MNLDFLGPSPHMNCNNACKWSCLIKLFMSIPIEFTHSTITLSYSLFNFELGTLYIIIILKF